VKRGKDSRINRQPKEKVILIEGAGTATAISVLKGISKDPRHHCRTVVVDIEEFVAGRYLADKFYKTPASKSDEYIDFMVDLCKKEGVSIYLPIIDYGFEKLSESKKRFAQAGVYIMIAEPESIKICADKLLTYEFFKKNNIPTPETFAVGDKSQARLDQGFLIKPRKGGRASLEVYKIKDKDDLERHLKESTNYIIQKVIDGTEFTSDCLSSLDGKIFIEAVVRERIETKGGLSTKAKVFDNDTSNKIKIHLKRIAILLGLPGVYNIQGFISNKGDIFFTEINPRFAGTHAFTIEAGLNSIKHLLDMLDGKNSEGIRKSIKINHKVKMVRYWSEIFVDGDEVWSWGKLLKSSKKR